MNILKAFIIISLIIVTSWTLTTKPVNHKHFIIESANFKLEKNNQTPKDLQSTILFKIGDVKTTTASSTQVSQTENRTYITKENKIIPSSLASTQTTKISTTNTQKNSDEELQEVANMLNENYSKAWEDMERKIYEERAKNRSKSDPNLKNNSKTSAPKINDSRYRDELITWNIWRSNIQNKIMDTSNVNAGYGTVFLFSFKVSETGHITNIKIFCTEFTNTNSIAAVKRAITNLEGQPILKFPKKSNRKVVEFTGGFMMGDSLQYASPDNYNDFESVRVRY